jgi:transposase, IS30 family
VTHSSEVRRAAFALLGGGCSARRVGTLLGVSRSQVSQWRLDAGGVIKTELRESPRYLSRADRYEIARLREHGLGVRAIGKRLDWAASTVSRELRRNDASRDGRRHRLVRGYQPELAHQLMLARRPRPKRSKLARWPALRVWVQRRLDEHDSPEQVAGRLRLEFGDDESMQISHETIYRAIYLRPRGELTRQLRAHLRTGRDQRRRRATRLSGGAIVDPVSIHERPEEIEGRLVPGHYEGDLIVGPAGTTAAIGTLVERTSGHLTVFHLPDNRGAEATVAALTATVRRPQWPVLSLTWDRGSEMARHRIFTYTTGVQVYFADPHAPWQRGSNENTNGLLREFFPKGTDLSQCTSEQIQAAEDNLNNRPRKRLRFRTPNEVMAEIMATDQGGVATIT